MPLRTLPAGDGRRPQMERRRKSPESATHRSKAAAFRCDLQRSAVPDGAPAAFSVGFGRGFVGQDCGRGFGRVQIGVEQADKHEANGAADELSGDVAGC